MNINTDNRYHKSQHEDDTLQSEFAATIPAVPTYTDNDLVVIAGPCSAESREQTLCTAKSLSAIGVKVYRAGLWKPRTRPGCFEGCGKKGLEWLREVKETTGMLTATEVACADHAEAAMAAGIDIMWVGARTTTNPFAVQDIASAISGSDVAVMVKNPANADLELWIGALQRLNNAGIRRLSAVHRGFSAYGSKFYRNPPQWQIPIELHRRLPNLQIICDPSHIGGRKDLVAPIAQQAIDLGFNGLIIECHCSPEHALSDASQQLTPEQLKSVLDALTRRNADDHMADMVALRQQIDQLDRELIEILSKRMNVVMEIGQLKKMHNLPVLQPKRYEALMKARVEEAAAMGLDREFTSAILAAIHAESVNRQLNL